MSFGYRYYNEATGTYTDSKCAEPTDRPDVAARLASIITAQKHGRARPEPAHRSGRIDRRSLAKAGVGETRVFNKPGAPSPTKLRLVVVLDLSGSMDGREATRAAQMAWDLILAAQRIPSVTLEVWSHTTGSLTHNGCKRTSFAHTKTCEEAECETLSPGAKPCTDDFILVTELWEPGVSRWQFHRNIHAVQFRGNEDGFALRVIANDVLKRLNSGERALFCMVSDGAPYYRGDEEDAHKYAHMREVCRDIRRKGHGVMSVSVSASLRKTTQDQMYGAEFVVQYSSNTSQLTQGIARAVGKALN